MRQIPLTRGLFALVDDEDYEMLSKCTWYAKYSQGRFYAARNNERHDGTLFMHQAIFGSKCDHKNRNGLDNRRENLRKATQQQQCCNQGLRKDNSTGYKGVTGPDKYGKYQSQIQRKNRKIYLGYHETKEEAARAYNKAAKRLHGEFAVLNFTQPKRNTASL